MSDYAAPARQQHMSLASLEAHGRVLELDVLSDLLAPLERWPTRAHSDLFPRLCAEAAALAALFSWPEAMRRLFEAYPINVGSTEDTLKDLRAMSAAISMLVHLMPTAAADGSIDLRNERRRRMPYSSYPTPPVVGRTIARFIASCLPDDGNHAVVLDPTIEAAPILLECAVVMSARSRIKLIGVDRAEGAICATSALFDRAMHASPHLLQRPELVCGDAFSEMSARAPLDAIVNNPPWGERVRNGADRFRGMADPYTYFVESAIRALRPGAPFGFVLPGQAVTGPASRELRHRLMSDCEVKVLATLPKGCFPRATVRTIVIMGRKKGVCGSSNAVRVIRYPAGVLEGLSAEPSHEMISADMLDAHGGPWLICASETSSQTASRSTIDLGQFTTVESGIVPYRTGRGRPPQTGEVLASTPFTFALPTEGAIPVLRGRQVRAFHCERPVEWVRLGKHLACVSGHAEEVEVPRVYLRELTRRDGRLVAAPAPHGTVPRYGVFRIRPTKGVSLLGLCAILNSPFIAQHVRANCDGQFRESFNRVRVGDVRRLPIPRRFLDDKAWALRLEVLCREMLDAPNSEKCDLRTNALFAYIEDAYRPDLMT